MCSRGTPKNTITIGSSRNPLGYSRAAAVACILGEPCVASSLWLQQRRSEVAVLAIQSCNSTGSQVLVTHRVVASTVEIYPAIHNHTPALNLLLLSAFKLA